MKVLCIPFCDIALYESKHRYLLAALGSDELAAVSIRDEIMSSPQFVTHVNINMNSQ